MILISISKVFYFWTEFLDNATNEITFLEQKKSKEKDVYFTFFDLRK